MAITQKIIINKNKKYLLPIFLIKIAFDIVFLGVDSTSNLRNSVYNFLYIDHDRITIFRIF